MAPLTPAWATERDSVSKKKKGFILNHEQGRIDWPLRACAPPRGGPAELCLSRPHVPSTDLTGGPLRAVPQSPPSPVHRPHGCPAQSCASVAPMSCPQTSQGAPSELCLSRPHVLSTDFTGGPLRAVPQSPLCPIRRPQGGPVRAVPQSPPHPICRPLGSAPASPLSAPP